MIKEENILLLVSSFSLQIFFSLSTCVMCIMGATLEKDMPSKHTMSQVNHFCIVRILGVSTQIVIMFGIAPNILKSNKALAHILCAFMILGLFDRYSNFS